MKIFLFGFANFILMMSSVSFRPATPFEPVAVIELFTSQGCSSCPPADQLLSKTIADAQSGNKKIFALSFHVDYWNHLGWTDPFSDKKYSDRQSHYAAQLNPQDIYTPQMIVNGQHEFVGSDQHALSDALQQAFTTNAAAEFKKLVVVQQPGKPLHVEYVLVGDYANCDINFALVSLSETTSVKRGENGGHTLKNENVVRQFISAKAGNAGEIDFASAPVPAPGNLAVIAFIQQNGDLKIIGAASASLEGKSE